MTADMRHIADAIVRQAKGLMERDGVVEPMFFIGNDKGMGIVPGQFTNQEMKMLTIQAVKFFAKSHNAKWVLSVSEAWMVKRDTAEEAAKVKKVSEAPDKQEVVMFSLETPEQRWLACADIQLSVNSEGRLRRFFNIPEWQVSNNSRGDLTNFLGA